MAINSVDAATVKKWLDNNEAIVIDVREPDEHKECNIPDATLIPLADISANKLPLCPGKKIVIHCKLGGRSEQACQKLLENDPELELYSLKGGIVSWTELGYPVNNNLKKIGMSINNQAQLFLGILIILGCVLFLISSLIGLVFILLIGFGLIIEVWLDRSIPITWLENMPWNKTNKS